MPARRAGIECSNPETQPLIPTDILHKANQVKPVPEVGVVKPIPEIQEQLFNRNVQRFRRGPVIKARRLLYHSALGSRVIKKKRSRFGSKNKKKMPAGSRGTTQMVNFTSKQDIICPDWCFLNPWFYASSSISTLVMGFASLRQQDRFCILPKFNFGRRCGAK